VVQFVGKEGMSIEDEALDIPLVWVAPLRRSGRDVRSEAVALVVAVALALAFAVLSETVLIVTTFLGLCFVFVPEIRSGLHAVYAVEQVQADLEGLRVEVTESAHAFAHWRPATHTLAWPAVQTIELEESEAADSLEPYRVCIRCGASSPLGRTLRFAVESKASAQRYVQGLRQLQQYSMLPTPTDILQ
jgi:uncharacterized membrane protein